MNIEQFHCARMMFVVLSDGTVLVGPEKCILSHKQWFQQIRGCEHLADEWIEKLTRGYILEGSLVAYSGINMSRHVNIFDVRRVVQLLMKRINIRIVGLGVKQGGSLQPWPPEETMSILPFLEDYN